MNRQTDRENKLSVKQILANFKSNIKADDNSSNQIIKFVELPASKIEVI